MDVKLLHSRVLNMTREVEEKTALEGSKVLASMERIKIRRLEHL